MAEKTVLTFIIKQFFFFLSFLIWQLCWLQFGSIIPSNYEIKKYLYQTISTISVRCSDIQIISIISYKTKMQ
jgi:hypothetical protein